VTDDDERRDDDELRAEPRKPGEHLLIDYPPNYVPMDEVLKLTEEREAAEADARARAKAKKKARKAKKREKKLAEHIDAPATNEKPKRETGFTEVPFELVEKVLLDREKSGDGRLKIRVPGVSPHMARHILRWYVHGQPSGLWLEDGRLQYGPAIRPVWDRETKWAKSAATISPTPRALRIPYR
jgi:hypothetical protein